MSAPALALDELMTVRSSTSQLSAPFPIEIERVFNRLQDIQDEAHRPESRNRPTDETIDRAREVMLRVVPSTYLMGAEVNAFQSEIHVTWEDDGRGKSVIVFFPGPREVKIYHEAVVDAAVVQHELVSTENVGDVSERLKWFFQ